MPSKLTAARSWLIACLLLFTTASFAQQKTVTGKVTGDKDKQPIIGATVSVKGSTIATQTGTDGGFTITVPNPNSILVISFVGFQTMDVSVTGLTDISISLKEGSSTLNEIVVTGYTSQRKKDITGAVAVVNTADLKVQPTIDAQSQLQGRASGVTVMQTGVPGGAAQVRVRGLGSFNNNSPLYVVDGVQTGSISNLSPNDIESMQVLKDAASASIYGVRGSNGVIVVTTKKGKKRGVNVTYDMFYGVQQPGKGFDLLNSQEWANLFFLAMKNTGTGSTAGTVFGTGANPILPDYLYYTGAPNNGVPIMNGNPGVDPAKYSLDYSLLGDVGYAPYIIVPTNKSGTNWYQEVTRNAPIQNHNVAVSGSSDAARYLFSMNYYDQQAVTEHQFYKRYTARLNSEYTIHKAFRLGENLQVSMAQGNTGPNIDEGNVISQTFRPNPLIPVYTIKHGDFAGTRGGTGPGTWGNAKNPLANLYRQRDNRNNNVNVFGNLYAELDLFKHITLRSSFGGSVNTSNASTFPFIEYEHVENTANTTATENFIRNYQWIWTNQATYRQEFGDHSVAAVVGYEAQEGGGRQVIGASTGFYTYDYRPFINLNNGGTQNLSGSVTYTPGSTVSYFGKVDYAFQGKYIASGTLRRDGSSKFLGDNRWGTFPAFSLGWRISDENFMKDIKFINDLKIRGSWGKMGNDAAVGASNAFTTFASNRQSSWYDVTGTQGQPAEGFFLSFVGNAGGKWETSITTNIGFDATLFNGTTEVVLDWYKKETQDLLYNPPGQGILGAVGANQPAFRNVGSMENTGFDLMINNRANITSDLRLITTLTFTTYNNKITAVTNDGADYFEFNSPANEANRIGGAATRNMAGHPLNTFYGYKVIGIFQNAAEVTASPTQAGAGPGRFKYADINGDKIINADDRTVIGDPNPDFTYGINIGLEYKAFDLSGFFYGVSGKENFNMGRNFTDFSTGFPGGKSKRALYESWLPDGSRPNATTPIQETQSPDGGFSSSQAVSSYYVEDASYFRLRNLQLGYTLPNDMIAKAKMSRLRIYIQATNVFTITKYSGLNPDVISTDDRASSVDMGAFPLVKQFLFGLSVNF